MKRESGFYWVTHYYYGLTIGEYNLESGLWYVIGSEYQQKESDFTNIDENRIIQK